MGEERRTGTSAIRLKASGAEVSQVKWRGRTLRIEESNSIENTARSGKESSFCSVFSRTLWASFRNVWQLLLSEAFAA